MEKKGNLEPLANNAPLELWTEDVTPAEAVDCRRCELHQHSKRIIWGEGNPQAPVIALLDNPGARENKLGEPFVCGARETLYTTVSRVGLKENDIYVTYVLRCRPKRKYDKELARNTCIEFLRNHLLEKKPDIIICLGNVAAQQYLGDDDATVKELRGKISHYEGIATAFSYHPLAVRRRPALFKLFLEDWQLVADHIYPKDLLL